MSDFLVEFEAELKKDVKHECPSCPISKGKKYKVEASQEPFIVKKKGRGEILVLLETPESKDTLDRFEKWLEANSISSYTIANAYGCRTSKFEIPSPLNKSYSKCNMFSHDDVRNYKVIIPVGRALHAITGTDDFTSWHDFREFLFNDTFIYTPITLNEKYGRMLRIYPIPKLIEFVKTDTFAELFAKKQFNFVRVFLKDYKEEVFEPYELVKVEDPYDFFKETWDYPSMAWDTETNNLNVHTVDFKAGCVTISFDGQTGYYLPFEKINKRQFAQYLKTKHQTGANIKYDKKVIRSEGIADYNNDFDDVILLAHVLNTDRRKNNLKMLAWFVGYGGYDQPLDDYKSKHKLNSYLDIPEPVLFPYATLDAIVTEKVRSYLYRLAQRQPEQLEMYREVLIPAIPVFIKAEMRGVPVDRKYMDHLSDYLIEKRDKAKGEIFEIIGREIDLNSPKQLGNVIEEMGLPNLGKSKDKFYLTGNEKLEEWAKMGYEIGKKIVEYRKSEKMLNTYAGKDTQEKDTSEIIDFFDDSIQDAKDEDIEGLVKYIEHDGRIHDDYRFAMQYTFRSAARLALMPKKGFEGKIFRPVISPDPDYVMGEIDYSGLQLRITAAYSEDPKMTEIFTTGHDDMHSESAQAFFMKDVTVEDFIKNKDKEPYKTFRNKAKGQVNFALIFSDDYYVLVQPIKNNWTEEEKEEYLKDVKEEHYIYNKKGDFDPVHTIANDIRHKFMERYAGVKKYIEWCHTTAKRQGYIDSINGIRRHLPYLLHEPNKWNYDEKKKINGYLNVSVNTRAQGTEAILMYKVLKRLNDKIEEMGLKSWIVGTVHDAIVTMDHKDELEIMAKLKQECMDDYTTFKVPLLSEIDNGPIWGFGTGIKPGMKNEEILDKIVKSFTMFKKDHPIYDRMERESVA